MTRNGVRIEARGAPQRRACPIAVPFNPGGRKAHLAAAPDAHAGEFFANVQAREITLLGVPGRIPPPVPPKIEHQADWQVSEEDAEKIRARIVLVKFEKQTHQIDAPPAVGLEPSLTPGQVQALKEGATAGENKAALAREFRISRETVYSYLAAPA